MARFFSARNKLGRAAALLSISAMTAVSGGISPAAAQSVDIEAIFNCSAGGPLGEQSPEQCVASRTLLLNNCTSCHAFVPIVKAQKTPDAWDALLAIHKPRVEQIGDDDYRQLRQFLAAHFNPQNPVPALPPELEALGTNTPE